jgi:hypothetical protein
MSSFPDFLFRLTPRDEQGTPLEIVTQKLIGTSGAVTAVNKTNAYVVPKGKILLLNTLDYFGQGALALVQSPEHVRVYGDRVGANNPLRLVSFLVDNGYWATSTEQILYSKVQQIGWMNQIMLPEDFQIYGEEYLTGIEAGHEMEIHFTGVLIPRGNVAI